MLRIVFDYSRWIFELGGMLLLIPDAVQSYRPPQAVAGADIGK